MNKHAQDYTGWFRYYLSKNEKDGQFRNGNKMSLSSTLATESNVHKKLRLVPRTG